MVPSMCLGRCIFFYFCSYISNSLTSFRSRDQRQFKYIQKYFLRIKLG